MSLKSYLIDRIPPEKYYESRFPRWNPHVRGNVLCPFHEDNKPSLSVALKNGGARCHASSCPNPRFGNIVHFEAELRGITERRAMRRLYREFIRKVVSRKNIAGYREAISADTRYLLKVKKEMGLPLSAVRKFGIGLDERTHRITIPVYDRYDNCVNVRFYRLPSERSSRDDAKLYNLDGYGQLDLFPWQCVPGFKIDEPLYIMASEKEAMLAITLGFQAITVTAGEGSWNAEWNWLLENRDVFLVLDRDKGGLHATKKFLKLFASVAKSVTQIVLPFRETRKDRKDFADWILKEKHTAQEFARLAKITRKKKGIFSKKKAVYQDGERNNFPSVPDYFDTQTYDIAAISSRAELLNSRIKTQGIVAAKSPTNYSLPWKFEVSIKKRKATKVELPIGRELLRFVRANDSDIQTTLADIVGSAEIDIKPIAFITATEVEVIPTIVADRDTPYAMQRCFYFGERIESNIPYALDIVPTSEIRTQETIGIITNIIPLSRSIERFEVTPEVVADLLDFAPEETLFEEKEDDAVYEKLCQLANQISHEHSHIYNRTDWHIVALLTWCSPIGWRFPNESDIQRGWLNSLALGDTETGKSKVCRSLQTLFKCGVFVNAENCTYVGLVGGAIKMGSGQLMLRWGRIPLSDRQLVVIEELSGLSVEEISNMSEVRSAGIARLDKGGINSETNSRTRLLCLSNVRHVKRTLQSYLYGCHAVQELVGHSEDIARFDFIITLVDSDVSVDVINSRDFATIANQTRSAIRAERFQTLINFIWSLTPDQIHFSEAAYEACLEETKALSALYHPSIPLFKGGSGRYKLGRIAASIACLLFSWHKNKIHVAPAHVRAASRILKSLYEKSSMRYGEYSRQMFDRETVKDVKVLRRGFLEKINRRALPKVVATLIHTTRFTGDELCAIAGITRLNADQLIGVMVREGAVKKGDANVWDITVAGKNWMEKFLKSITRDKSN